NVRIGYEASGDGRVTVSGSGSRLDATGEIQVSASGDGSLTVSDGGAVTADGITMGDIASKQSRMLVTGAGSQVDLNWLAVRGMGGASVDIKDGGVVNTGSASVGDWIFASGVLYGTSGTVVIENAGSQLNISGDLSVGGFDGSITVRDHGLLTSGDAFIGSWYADSLDAVPGTGGTVLVDGEGSAWHSTGTLFIGMDGFGELNIRNGADVTSASGVIGNSRPTEEIAGHGVVNVEGNGSTWNSGDLLVIGQEGDGTLT